MAVNQEVNLKKVLGLTDVLGFVFGGIIGAGVLVMTSIAIGLTGKGVILAFAIAGIINCVNILPMAQLASALPTTGAGYRYSSWLLGSKWGFLWQLGIVFSKVTIALYALAFAQYLQGLFPAIPLKTTALIMLTFFFCLESSGNQNRGGYREVDDGYQDFRIICIWNLGDIVSQYLRLCFGGSIDALRFG